MRLAYFIGLTRASQDVSLKINVDNDEDDEDDEKSSEPDQTCERLLNTENLASYKELLMRVSTQQKKSLDSTSAESCQR